MSSSARSIKKEVGRIDNNVSDAFSSAESSARKEFGRIDNNFNKAFGSPQQFAKSWFFAGLNKRYYDDPKKQAKDGTRAGNIATQNAQRQATRADQAFNRANQKKPDIASLLRRNQRQGAPGTMLTGPSGVPDDSRTLGSSSLLGS